MQLPKIFYSKLFLSALLILLIGAFALELQQWQKRHAINKEIALLVNQGKQLDQKNKDLEQSLQYFSSDDYKEKIAREQLGLKKEGEIVVNFPTTTSSQNNSAAAAKLSNPQKWWQYFFLKKS